MFRQMKAAKNLKYMKDTGVHIYMGSEAAQYDTEQLHLAISKLGFLAREQSVHRHK